MLTAAIGCPMGLAMIESMSVPMRNEIATLIASSNTRQSLHEVEGDADSRLPHPRIPAMEVAARRAQGTAMLALEASSLICNAESNPAGLMFSTTRKTSWRKTHKWSREARGS